MMILAAVLYVTMIVSLVVASYRMNKDVYYVPRDRFRFVASELLRDTPFLVRQDMAPGAPFQLICAGPGDTSPRAGYGHNVLADCGLQHTEHAAELACELAPSSITALYESREMLLLRLDSWSDMSAKEATTFTCRPSDLCPTPSVCQQAGACADTIETAEPRA